MLSSRRTASPNPCPRVNRSDLECTGEGEDGLRLGLGKVKGIYWQQEARLLAARQEGGKFIGLGDLLTR